MKILTILFFIIISNSTFAQDSIVFVKATKDSIPDLISSVSGLEINSTKSSIPAIYTNTYELSKIEKDSIWNSEFNKPKTQNLLKGIKYSKNKELYFNENQINLFARLNSNTISSEIKKKLLIEKFKYDKKSSKNHKNLGPDFNCGLGKPRVIEFSSRNKAINHYINVYNYKFNLFDLDGILLMGVNYKQEKPIQSISIFKKNQFKLNEIRKLKILGAEVNPYSQTVQSSDLLVIYYKVK